MTLFIFSSLIKMARLTMIEVQLNGSAETEAKPVQFATHELDGNISCTRTEMDNYDYLWLVLILYGEVKYV